MLTIKEAAAYFNLGENKIDTILNENRDSLLLMNGSKRLVKRKAFEQWIDNTSVC